MLQAKILTSSASRSHFSGSSTILRDSEDSIYRISRADVEERQAPPIRQGDWEAGAWNSYPELLRWWLTNDPPQENQWVIIADAAGIVLRNMDHLVPAISSDMAPDPGVDFYWARGPEEHAPNGKAASPGLCGVRGGCLPVLLEKWEAFRERPYDAGQEGSMWADLVADLPLRKRPFEKGEVYAPRVGAVDWEALGEAAFVTVPDWPEKERWKFLQALYFGNYFGDETGLMLSILDP